jgi:hypothetical protein
VVRLELLAKSLEDVNTDVFIAAALRVASKQIRDAIKGE